MYQNEVKAIEQLISNYFNGIFYGKVPLLASSFDRNAVIYGDIKGEDYLKDIPEYLAGVSNRKSPDELGEIFEMKIIGLDIMGKIAMAKLHVPMLGYNYYDYISLSKKDGEWKIVNKLFTHVD